MRSVGESFELIFVAILAGIAADVVSGAVGWWFGLAGLTSQLKRLGRTARSEPYDRDCQRGANEKRLDDSV